MTDISLLPQDFRDKEEELKKQQGAEQPPAVDSSMHVPKEEAEDIEVIEVEEGEVEQVLSNEPFLTKMIYKAGVWLEGMRDKLFKAHKPEPPPKAPPQFFAPPKAKPPAVMPMAPAPATPASPTAQAVPPVAAKPTGTAPVAQIRPVTPQPQAKARIIPSAATPRKVRIIKRTRKPVHVSLLDEDVVRQMQVNVPKRKFTLAFLTVFFAAVFVASFFLLDQQRANAFADQQAANQEMQSLKGQIKDMQGKWATFQDLEPRLMALNDLMDHHVSILNVLKFLEQRTLTDVSYSGFLLDSGGQVHLNVTAPTYQAAARQLMIFKDSPEVKNVDANSFTYLSDGKGANVTFPLTLQLQTQALLFE
ncbi:MAG: hypothetical protein PHC53_03365 [Patescibacteria group bacterium]|nr:hypothetical protein [Patescibacteria group bacterium]